MQETVEETAEEAVEALIEYVQSSDFNGDRLEKYEHAVLEATLREHAPLYYAYVNLRDEHAVLEAPGGRSS